MGRYLTIGFVVMFFLFGAIQLCLCGNETVDWRNRERDALLKLKGSFKDPSERLSSWNGNDYCQWAGVGCNNITGYVVNIDLRNPCHSRGPQGDFSQNCPWRSFELEAQQVNPSLLQLKCLGQLDLSGNNFHASPIPIFFQSMKELRYLALSDANFSGMVPQHLGNLTNLHFLDLSYNNIYSYDINWVSQLSSLQELNLSGVYLSEAQNLLQVLYMHPSLLQIHFMSCGLNKWSRPRQFVNVTNLSKVEVFNLADNELEAQTLDPFENMTSVSVLDLSYNNLNSVPLWLGNFHNLVHLGLGGNNLSGSPPSAIQNLTSITDLLLYYNNLDSVPPWMGEFKNLVALDLSMNEIYGPIPDAFRNMTSLSILDLSQNYLVSVPSWLSELKSLVHLDLSRNDITHVEDSISSILRNICHLKILDLSENKCQGEAFLDYALPNCTRYDLEELNLSHNKFNGFLPTWLAQLENLVFLDLRSNFFNGSIPFSLGKLSNLRQLTLGQNFFNGTIPETLGELQNLSHLDLSENYLVGVVPDSITGLVNLNYLILSNNNLNGFLPDTIGQLINLNTLLLSSNTFHGMIPKSFELLANLKYIDLSNNSLSGEIPQNLSQLLNLNTFYASGNKFHGKIPQNLGQLVNLRNIDFSYNALEGKFSEIRWSQYLSYLNLSFNFFTGSLPENIGDKMLDIESLILGNNNISGSIPNSLCKIKTLYNLDLSRNNLSGEIPNCWAKTQKLNEINLSFNKLSGFIPSSLGALSSLAWLHLNNNNLHGKLPSFPRILKELLILDLGDNHLSDIIPSWIGHVFPSMQILRLRKNLFIGTIPSTLCQVSSLKILDLASNNLEGPIPHCIGDLKGMMLQNNSDGKNIAMSPKAQSDLRWYEQEVMQVMKGIVLDYTRNLKLVANLDLSNNNLNGSIPEGITSLIALQGLNLSYNHLTGEIPKMIGEMKSLESIDISHNKISGTIPSSISSLTWLSHLNLSYNNISGPIPRDNQFLTLGDPFNYIGNPYLCGLPLPNKCPGDESGWRHENNGYEDSDGKDDLEKIWFYFVITVGFVAGFWGVIGIMLFDKDWRHASPGWVDDLAHWIYVRIVTQQVRLRAFFG